MKLLKPSRTGAEPIAHHSHISGKMAERHEA